MPMRSLSLRLARSTIRMHHGPAWRIDKLNPVHDLIICLTGRGLYHIDGEEITLYGHRGKVTVVDFWGFW